MLRAVRSETSRRRPGPAALLSLLLAALAFIFGVIVIVRLPLALAATVFLIILLGAGIGALLAALRATVEEPLRSLASVIEAYRGGDYTIRSNRESAGASIEVLAQEINKLGDALLSQRLRAMEANALLDKMIAALDVAVLAFDGGGKLRLLNAAALRLLALDSDGAVGRDAIELGLADLLTGEGGTHISTSIGGRSGRWQVTHGSFREEGLSQHLLIISDVREVLRAEERVAWQRLLRVIGHEINNSLAPIKSIAETLHETLEESLTTGELRNDSIAGLRIIADRAVALQRFLSQYGRLARLPPPQRRWVRLAPLLARVVALEKKGRIEVVVGDRLEAYVDEDQLEQALINLLRNGIEAQSGEDGLITVAAQSRGAALCLLVTDEGPGITNPDNLFVPFFTTKPGGSGIGLILCRQIAEAHGGTLSLSARGDARGCVATLEIPDSVRRTE